MALTDELVSVWHMNNDWTDSFGNNDGSPSGVTFDASEKKLGSHAGYFDGVDDYTLFGADSSLKPTDAFSISMWFRNEFTGAGLLMASRANSSATTGYLLFFGQNQLYFLTSTTGSSWTTVFTSDSTLLSNTWYHMVVTWESGSQKMYLDNVLQSNSGNASGSLVYDSGEIHIGANYPDLTSDYKGQMDELIFWNRALDAEDVAELWNSGDGIEIGVEEGILLFSRARMVNLGGNLGGLTKSTLNNS